MRIDAAPTERESVSTIPARARTRNRRPSATAGDEPHGGLNSLGFLGTLCNSLLLIAHGGRQQANGSRPSSD